MVEIRYISWTGHIQAANIEPRISRTVYFMFDTNLKFRSVRRSLDRTMAGIIGLRIFVNLNLEDRFSVCVHLKYNFQIDFLFYMFRKC